MLSAKPEGVNSILRAHVAEGELRSSRPLHVWTYIQRKEESQAW